MLFLITNTVLDVSLGVLWWVTKQTTLGVYNGVHYLVHNPEHEDDIDETHNDINQDNLELISVKELQGSIIELRREIVDLKKRLVKN